MTLRRTPWCILWMALVLWLAAAWSSAGEVGQSGVSPDSSSFAPSRTSPDELLRFYIIAHERKDLQMYEEALHKQYRYWLDSEMAVKMKRKWGRTWISRAKDIFAADSMFSDPIVKAIHVRLLPLSGWAPATAPVATDSGWVMPVGGMEIMVEPLVDFEIFKSTGGTQVIHITRTNMLILVVPDPEVPGSWVILRIKEEYHAN